MSLFPGFGVTQERPLSRSLKTSLCVQGRACGLLKRYVHCLPRDPADGRLQHMVGGGQTRGLGLRSFHVMLAHQ